MTQQIGIASDHGGKILKQKIVSFLKDQSWEVLDFGVPENSNLSVDYPDYAEKLAREISSRSLPRGILVCGSGIGMSIAANKFPGVRAALVSDEYTAAMCRKHNDANILCLGERVINHDRALDFIRIWLSTEFEGQRHQGRLAKIDAIEQTIQSKNSR